jgi:DNA-binding NarL/FixJ family response regulator
VSVYDKLTGREQDLIPLIARELSNKQIADALHLRPQSVKNAIRALRKKLKATSRMEIVDLSGWNPKF